MHNLSKNKPTNQTTQKRQQKSTKAARPHLQPVAKVHGTAGNKRATCLQSSTKGTQVVLKTCSEKGRKDPAHDKLRDAGEESLEFAEKQDLTEHGQLLREIIQLKKLINQRMTVAISRWAAHNHYETDEEKVAVLCTASTALLRETDHFPTGFGFFLSPECSYGYDVEPKLSNLYDAIMVLDDKQTQDYLLCFLYDFSLKRSALRSIESARFNLLNEVKTWMRTVLCHPVLSGGDFSQFGDILEIDKNLAECYHKVGEGMKKLRLLHHIIIYPALLKPHSRKKPQRGKTRHSAKTTGQSSRPGSQFSPHVGLACPAIVDLGAAIDVARNLDNSTMMDCMEIVVGSLAQSMFDTELEISRIGDSIQKTKAAIQQIRQQNDFVNKTINKLTAPMTKHEKQIIVGRRFDFNWMDPEPSGRFKKKNTACQTTLTGPGPYHHNPPQTFEEDTEPSYLNTNWNAKENQQPGKDTHTGNDTPFSLLDSNDDVMLDSKLISLTNLESSSSLNKKRKRRKPTATVEPTEEAEGSEEETPDTLLEMTRRFNESCVDYINSLNITMLNIKDNNKEAAEKVSEREKSVTSLAVKIQVLMDIMDSQINNLPSFHFETGGLRRTNHKPLDHNCRLCSCHLSAGHGGETIDPHKTVNCLVCANLFSSVKNKYKEISQTLDLALTVIKRAMSEIGRKDTCNFSLMNEWLELDKVMLDLGLLSDTEEGDVLLKAKEVTCMINTLTFCNIEMMKKCQARQVHTQRLGVVLEEIEKGLDKAEELLETSAIQVSRLRCRKTFLPIGMIMRATRCLHCKCYNSPFEQHVPNVCDRQRYSLTTALFTVKQGMSAVQCRVQGTPDETSKLVIGVDPNVLELIARTASMLSEAADTAVDLPSVRSRTSQLGGVGSSSIVIPDLRTPKSNAKNLRPSISKQ